MRGAKRGSGREGSQREEGAGGRRYERTRGKEKDLGVWKGVVEGEKERREIETGEKGGEGVKKGRPGKE